MAPSFSTIITTEMNVTDTTLAPAFTSANLEITYLPLTYIFTFGKHRTKSMEEVLDTDPGYILWAAQNIDWFKVSPDVLSEAAYRAPRSSVKPKEEQPTIDPEYVFADYGDLFD